MNDDIELTSVPNEKYQKFFDRFSEIETFDISQWKLVHLLGYFMKKYQDYYHTPYQWKFNTELPSKCFETWQMKTLGSKLSTNPLILKEYIDWVFQNIVPKAKRKLTSISFMTKDEVVNDYKLNVLLAGQNQTNVDRSTPLAVHYREAWLQGSGMTIQTYGNLAFIAQIEPRAENIIKGFDKLKEVGFDMSVLSRIV
jgi:hypothetical protein